MHMITASNGVVFLRSAMINLPHGFATRLGGVSTLPHTATLNLAFGRGDEESLVMENLSRFCAAVGVDSEVISLPQVHSTVVRTVDMADRGLGYRRSAAGQTADGYVTRTPALTIGVKTADCVPILLADEEAGVIGALHAGWRGTVAGIAREGVGKMCALGARPDRIVAAIGPAIGNCCFTVGEDFANALAASACSALCLPHLHRQNGRLSADLVAMNIDILTASGVSPAQIDTAGLCTCCDTAHFYSHRASHGQRGTMLSVIALPDDGVARYA